MANYTATFSKHATTTGGAVDKITFDSSARRFEIVNLGASDLYVRSDATDPTVGGDNTELVRAGDAIIHEPNSPVAELRVISTANTEYHIARINT